MERDAETLRRITTDNIALAPQIESKQNWTDREKERINTLEVTRTFLEQRKTELRQLEKLSERNKYKSTSRKHQKAKLGTRESTLGRRHGRIGNRVRRICEGKHTQRWTNTGNQEQQ